MLRKTPFQWDLSSQTDSKRELGVHKKIRSVWNKQPGCWNWQAQKGSPGILRCNVGSRKSSLKTHRDQTHSATQGILALALLCELLICKMCTFRLYLSNVRQVHWNCKPELSKCILIIHFVQPYIPKTWQFLHEINIKYTEIFYILS